jgi:hypothetical protein
VWPFASGKKYAETWIHRPGDAIMKPYEVPVNDVVIHDVVLTKPGPLRPSKELIDAVAQSRRDIIRIAPWASIIYCREVALLQDPDKGSACMAVTMFDRDRDCITIVIGLDDLTPSFLRTLSHHEAYHYCEPLMNEAEFLSVKAWSEYLLTIDKPLFVSRGLRDYWWSLWYERVTWSFERYCYAIDPNWNDPLIEKERGFDKDLDWFPRDVVDIFDSVWRGDIGKRIV